MTTLFTGSKPTAAYESSSHSSFGHLVGASVVLRNHRPSPGSSFCMPCASRNPGLTEFFCQWSVGSLKAKSWDVFTIKYHEYPLVSVCVSVFPIDFLSFLSLFEVPWGEFLGGSARCSGHPMENIPWFASCLAQIGCPNCPTHQSRLMTQNLLEHAGAVEFFATERLGLVKQSLSISRHGQFPGIRTNRPAQQRETRATVGILLSKTNFLPDWDLEKFTLKKSNPFVEGIPPIPPKTFSLPRAESGRHRSSLFKGWSCAGGVCLEHLELGSWSDLMFACYGPLYPSVHTRWLFWQWMCLSQNIVF